MATQTLVSHIATQPEWQDRLYKQVALRIAELIEHGTLRPGERIPSVRELSEQEEVSIATVMQAYRVLESRGLIEARPQSGYYVRAKLWSPPPDRFDNRGPVVSNGALGAASSRAATKEV